MTKLISFNLLCDAMHMQLMHHPRMHRRMASNSQYTLPLSFPHKKSTGGYSQLCSKQSSNGPSLENFLTIGILNATHIALRR